MSKSKAAYSYLHGSQARDVQSTHVKYDTFAMNKKIGNN